jgi:hypothetical protein
MKLAVAYNIFDGVENLENSVLNIQPVTDILIGVYQTISNYGNIIEKNIPALLNRLGFHYIIEYIPDLTKTPHFNEIAKRNIGLEIARQNGCEMFMTMDCDEMYSIAELKRAKNEFERSGCDASACMMQTYYGNNRMVYAEPETYYVTLFFKTDTKDIRKFKEFVQFPVLADPTRKLPSNKVLVFPRSTIQMHHYSYVRDDIRMKLINSSALCNYQERVNEIVEAYENWDGGNLGLTVHGLTPLVDVETLNIPLPEFV